MIKVEESRFNDLVSIIKEREDVQEIFLLDAEGNVAFKSGEFPLEADEAKAILKSWKEKEQAIMFQGSRFAILKNDDIQLAAKNIAQGKGNIAGSITKEGDYLIIHTEDVGMLLEWSIWLNKLAWS